MFDEAYRVWQACIASASSAGVAWMKFASSGVGYDCKNETIRGSSRRRDNDLSPDILDRIAANRAGYLEAASAMKESNEPRGQVINFHSAAASRHRRSNAVRSSAPDVQVKS